MKQYPVLKTLRLLRKLVRYRRGGFTRAEVEDLAGDLFDFAVKLLDQVEEDGDEQT